MRCFLAIELPDDVKAHLVRVQAALCDDPDNVQSVTWVRPENWHITLKFLGDVPDAGVAQLSEALRQVRGEPMPLCIDRTVFFPRRGPVRVVGVEVGGDRGRLSQLHDQVERVCESSGFPPETRPYTGHVTLGRSRTGERGGGWVSLRNVVLPELFPGPTFVVDEFAMFQSDLNPQGSRYTRLASFAFAGSDIEKF